MAQRPAGPKAQRPRAHGLRRPSGPRPAACDGPAARRPSPDFPELSTLMYRSSFGVQNGGQKFTYDPMKCPEHWAFIPSTDRTGDGRSVPGTGDRCLGQNRRSRRKLFRINCPITNLWNKLTASRWNWSPVSGTDLPSQALIFCPLHWSSVPCTDLSLSLALIFCP